MTRPSCWLVGLSPTDSASTAAIPGGIEQRTKSSIGVPSFDALWFVAYNTEYKRGTLMQDRRADDGADVHAHFCGVLAPIVDALAGPRRPGCAEPLGAPAATPKSPARAAPCCASTRPRARRRPRSATASRPRRS